MRRNKAIGPTIRGCETKSLKNGIQREGEDSGKWGHYSSHAIIASFDYYHLYIVVVVVVIGKDEDMHGPLRLGFKSKLNLLLLVLLF